MRSLLLRLAAVALAVALSGCFQMASLLTVRPDGSAKLVETVTLSPQALSFAADGEREIADRALLEARAAALGPGVRLAGLDKTESGYTATYAIAHVDSLRFTLPNAPTGPEAVPDSAEADAPFTFALRRDAAGVHTLVVTVPDEQTAPRDPDAAPADAAQQQQALGMARMLLGDARVTARVAVQGTVVDTDALFATDDGLTLVDLQMGALFDLLAEHPELMGAAEPSPAELARLAAGRDGLQIQLPGTVRVRFR